MSEIRFEAPTVRGSDPRSSKDAAIPDCMAHLCPYGFTTSGRMLEKEGEGTWGRVPANIQTRGRLHKWCPVGLHVVCRSALRLWFSASHSLPYHCTSIPSVSPFSALISAMSASTASNRTDVCVCVCVCVCAGGVEWARVWPHTLAPSLCSVWCLMRLMHQQALRRWRQRWSLLRWLN